MKCNNFSNVLRCDYVSFHWLIKKVLIINDEVEVFYFYRWKNVLCVLFWPHPSQMIQTQGLLIPSKTWISQIIQILLMSFRWVFLFTVEWQLFQLTLCLNTDFNCYGSFELSFTDNATTRTYGFVLLISNVLALIVMEINMRSISQLIRGIRRVLQRLLKNYNGIAISTFLILISTPVLPVILDFNLDNSELFTLSFGFYHLDQFCGSSMYYPRFLHNYCYFLLDYPSTSQHPDLLHYPFSYYLFR